MTPFQRAQLAQGRLDLVRRYRANPRLWPDGIDAMSPDKGEQWYRGKEAHWDKVIAEDDAKRRALLTDRATEASVNTVRIEPVNTTGQDTAPVNKRAEYMRRYMASRRAKAAKP